MGKLYWIDHETKEQEPIICQICEKGHLNIEKDGAVTCPVCGVKNKPDRSHTHE